MLADRHYFQPYARSPMRTATVWLLIVNAAAFLVQQLVQYYGPLRAQFVLGHLDLNANEVLHGHVWQLLTFQFLHANTMHLLLNSVIIYFFGRAMEEALGIFSFLRLYFLSGIFGGVLQTLGGYVLPSHFGPGAIGASAGAFGLVAAFATMNPEQPITTLLALIIPVTMRAKFLLVFEGLLTVFGLLVPHDNVAHAAHLGGMLYGMAYVIFILRPPEGLIHWGHPPQVEPLRELVKAPSGRKALWRKAQRAEPSGITADEFISQEVDPILDKISAKGIHSLTPRERRILEEARSKMGKR